MRRLPPGVDAFIRQNCATYTSRQMAAMSKEALGFELTTQQIHSYMSRKKIRGPKKGKKFPERRITTPDMDAFIREHYIGTGPTEMAKLVNKTFGSSFTGDQMANYYGRNNLNSGLDGRFQKGTTPVNKGKSWEEFMPPEAQERCRTTTFKPGHVPHNGGTPIGTIRIRNGHKNRGERPYTWQKVAEPNVWRMKHIIEWEEHNGPVPEGYIVTFANGDTLNWHIENLILETRAQHAVKNRWGLHGYDAESAQVANTLADIKSAVNRIKHGKKKKGDGKKRGDSMKKRELTYGELICRLCKLRDELNSTPEGRAALVDVIVTLKYAIRDGVTYKEASENVKACESVCGRAKAKTGRSKY